MFYLNIKYFDKDFKVYLLNKLQILPFLFCFLLLFKD